jgi:hypothetical protein
MHDLRLLLSMASATDFSESAMMWTLPPSNR